MGLLSHILAMQQREAEAGGTQLAAESYAPEAGDFYAWCETQRFSHAALFQRDGHDFYIIKAVGLDAETIARSHSSREFWNAALQADAGWQSVSREETAFAGFYQLLSDEVRNRAQTLHFIKLEDSVLMLVQEDDDFTLSANSEAVKRDIIHILYARPAPEDIHAVESAVNRGLQTGEATLLVLSVREAVEGAVQYVPFFDDAAKEKVLRTIYAEIARACAVLFQKPNCCVPGKAGELRIAFFSKDDVDEQLLRFHIAGALAPLIGAPYAQDVKLLTAGICPNSLGTLSFLRQS